MTDPTLDYRRGPDPKRVSLPPEAARKLADAREKLGNRRPRRHLTGAVIGDGESPESRQTALALTHEWRAEVAQRACSIAVMRPCEWCVKEDQ